MLLFNKRIFNNDYLIALALVLSVIYFMYEISNIDFTNEVDVFMYNGREISAFISKDDVEEYQSCSINNLGKKFDCNKINKSVYNEMKFNYISQNEMKEKSQLQVN